MTNKSFAHLFEGLQITSETVKPYQFSVLPPEITCYFKPATEDNKPFATALLLLGEKRRRRARGKRAKVTTKLLARQRNENIVLVAKYCFTGWDGMTYSDEETGEVHPAQFTKEAALEFLKQLPHYAFDEFFAWLQEPLNFIDDEDDDADDEDELTLDGLDELVEEANSNQPDTSGDEAAGTDEVKPLGKSSEELSSGNSDTNETGSA